MNKSINTFQHANELISEHHYHSKNEKINYSLQEELIKLFPKNPYPTQLKIAEHLYNELEKEDKKVVIVESPTGTGKTYALLVGVLNWLKNHPHQMKTVKKAEKVAEEENSETGSMPSWIIGKKKQDKVENLIFLKEDRIGKLKSMKEAKENKNKKFVKPSKESHTEPQKLEWEVQEIEDEPFDNIPNNKRKLGEQVLQAVESIFTDQDSLPKVIFVSRTHSQLSQVMDSIKKMDLPFRYVSMASKDHLCVHSQIEKNRVHEKCQYLLTHGGCPYYHQESIEDFIGLPVEESRKLGEKNSICSYFATKNLLPISDILCIPYSTILSSEIRSRLSINISNSIIILDEAHNVIEQELSMKSPEISFQELALLCERIDEYKGRYGNKMKGENLGLLAHMQEICRKIMGILKGEVEKMKEEKERNGKEEQNYVKLTKIELFVKLKLPEVKVFQIKNYISLSNFDQKLVHFTPEPSLKTSKPKPFSIEIINKFLDFITALVTQNFSTEISSASPTTILLKNLNVSASESSIKIFTMQPQELANIIKESRLTILAGGTMEPIGELVNLFHRNEIEHGFIRGEPVIKKEQCNVFCIGGVKKDKDVRDGYKLMYTYKNLLNEGKQLMLHTVSLIQAIVAKAPPKSGTVIFIQNYNLIETLSEFLGKEINGFEVFYDMNPEKMAKVEKGSKNAFEKYREKIQDKGASAILVSVIGGKLSEGINFSDELARAIVVLGLPYPNIKAPEIIEKMLFLDSKYEKLAPKPIFESANKKLRESLDSSNNSSTGTLETGQLYYENCCIKALNQTIGRGIRHIDDYADIYLIDSRFAGVSHKLSKWLQKSLNFIDFYLC